MPDQTRVVGVGPHAGTVRGADGAILEIPTGWTLVPPGDAALTRRVKAAGPSWTVQEKKGRKIFSRGVWASAEVVESIRAQLAAERSSPSYERRRLADAVRRDRKQADYVDNFHAAVIAFLNFAPIHAALAARLAAAVADHATPVGSGTVARTSQIPIDRRAEAAVIAWMRHQTTGYDGMAIPRVKGKRREVRRMLAEQSRRLLQRYRAGISVDPTVCLLSRALNADQPMTNEGITVNRPA